MTLEPFESRALGGPCPVDLPDGGAADDARGAAPRHRAYGPAGPLRVECRSAGSVNARGRTAGQPAGAALLSSVAGSARASPDAARAAGMAAAMSAASSAMPQPITRPVRKPLSEVKV